MKLLSFSYRDYDWELNNLYLQDLNLIVGKNSTGKSRVLSTLDMFVKMITGKRDINWSGQWQASFKTDDNRRLDYSFGTTVRGGIEYERIYLTHNSIEGAGNLVLERQRNQNICRLQNSNRNNVWETIVPPANKLVLHTRRDVRAYPYLEKIALWAENSHGFKFGNISPTAFLNMQEYDLLMAVEDIPALFMSLSLRQASINRIKQEFNNLGYNISRIWVNNNGQNTLLLVQEEGINKPLPHFKLSQGMFRSLAMIIFLEYLIVVKRPQTIIIDDLCESLDYERSTKLGKLIFDKCQQNHVQLICTSNDGFLMDVVDIDNWNVLQRNGTQVTAINTQTHPSIFEDFQFTGLSNFFFFTSNYIAQKLAQQ